MRGSKAVGETINHASYSLLLNFKMPCMIKVIGVSSDSQGWIFCWNYQNCPPTE
jgi:hypothetical protein